MQRLLIIDGNAILHRTYHALPPLTNSKNMPVGAIYGFLSILIRTIHNIKPTHLIVAFDRPEPTFRKKLFVEYQSQRPELEDSMISQIVNLHELLTKMAIAIFEVPGFEADDVIGTLAKQAKNEEVVIVTGDRDILQLVNEKTRVLMPVKGISEAKLFGIAEVVEKMGVMPSELIELKALTGDASDNYPGVTGIGPKTAEELIKKFGTVENIYKNIGEIEGKLKEKLIKGEENAKMSKKLATIETQVPIKLNLKTAEIINLDRPDVRSLFEEWEFRSLIPRLSGNNKIQVTRNKEKKNKNSAAEQTSLF